MTLRCRLPTTVSSSSRPRTSLTFSNYWFPIVMLFPGAANHYPILLVRIHEDDSPPRQGILPGFLQVPVFVVETPLFGNSYTRNATPILRIFRVVLPWHLTNVEGSVLISKLLCCTYYLPNLSVVLIIFVPDRCPPLNTAHFNPSYSYYPVFAAFNAVRSKSSTLYRSSAFDIATPALPSRHVCGWQLTGHYETSTSTFSCLEMLLILDIVLRCRNTFCRYVSDAAWDEQVFNLLSDKCGGYLVEA